MKKDSTHPHVDNNVILAYEDFRTKYSLINNQNWTILVRDFLKIIPRKVHSDFSKRMICGWLAALCEKAYYVTVHGKQEASRVLFKKQLVNLVQQNTLPKYLTQDGPVLCGKKQPSFIESIIPTLERYEVMEFLSKKFTLGIKAIIIGGSMSYGPFYSIRGNIDVGEVSDIDGLVIIDDMFLGSEEIDLTNNLVDDMFFSEEITSFVKRVKLFRRLLLAGKADVLSQRFSVKEKGFTVSLHFLPISVFTEITTGSIVKALSDGQEKERFLKDFRTDEFTHPCMATNSFIATRHESLITGHAIDGGYISYMPGYIISQGTLFLGPYHTIVYPAFLVFYDKDGLVTECVKKFERFLYEEVQKQRLKYPFASYNKGHNRYDIFAPGRYEEGNNSFIHPKDFEKYMIPTRVQILIAQDNIKSENHSKLTCDMPTTINARRKLAKWKHKTLMFAEAEIEKFRKESYSSLMLKSLKKDGKSFYTICTIPSIQKEFVHLKKPFLHYDTGQVIVSILEQENILPKDLFKLKEYNELAKKFGRVFVSSLYDITDKEKRYPIHLSLIIRT